MITVNYGLGTFVNNVWKYSDMILYSDYTQSPTYDSTKTPIGVRVAPGKFFNNGLDRWLSLVNLSLFFPNTGTVETGNTSSNPGAGIRWGSENYSDSEDHMIYLNKDSNYTPLATYDKSQIIRFEAPGYNHYIKSYDFIPNDNSTGVTDPINSDYKYSSLSSTAYPNSNYVPNFFDEKYQKNSEIFRGILSQDDGSKLTSLMLAKQTVIYQSVPENTNIFGNYPAAWLCNVFSANANSIGWYLPSITELIYVAINVTKINTLLATIGSTLAVQLPTSATTSTLGSNLISSSCTTRSGSTCDYFSLNFSEMYIEEIIENKSDTSSRVRAMLAF